MAKIIAHSSSKVYIQCPSCNHKFDLFKQKCPYCKKYHNPLC